MEDEGLRQALAVLDAYKAQLDSLSSQLQLLQMSLEEAVRARETLQAFAKAKVGDEIMVPIGASSFIFAQVADTEKAVVGIGNRLSQERPLNEAVEYLDANIEEIGEALKKATEAGAELENRARQLSAAIQQEYQKQ
jgi:prefoldin alpha subunit